MTQDYERKGGIKSKVPTKEYLDNFDRIFRQKQEEDKCPCTNADKDCKDEDNACCNKA